MDMKRLYEILGETTMQFRKGAVFEGSPHLVEQMNAGLGDEGLKGGGVLEVYLMPPDSDMGHLEKVDLHFITIGVDRAKAEAARAEFVAILNHWPNDELAGGPSYISVGGTIGDQGAAFQIFALGKVLGLWDIITPATFGMVGEEAARAAGAGYIMITGYRPRPD